MADAIPHSPVGWRPSAAIARSPPSAATTAANLTCAQFVMMRRIDGTLRACMRVLTWQAPPSNNFGIRVLSLARGYAHAATIFGVVSQTDHSKVECGHGRSTMQPSSQL